jgi:cobalt/nickel transport system permease protein
MRHSFLDRYSRLESPIHGIDVSVKLLLLILLLVAIVTTPISLYAVFALVSIMLLAVAFVSRIPLMFLIRRMLLLELFVMGVAILSLLQPNGITLFAALVARSTLCLFAIVLFSNTTPFSELLDLLRKWRVPLLLITLLALLYRYLFVLVDELERMQRARTSRTFTRKRVVVWHSLATIVSQLFVRSTERAERIYAAMCARGWQ